MGERLVNSLSVRLDLAMAVTGAVAETHADAVRQGGGGRWQGHRIAEGAA